MFHLLFILSHFLSRLHPALLRPGRVDVKALIGYATSYQLCCMFARFHQQSTEAQCEEFAQAVEKSGHNFSPAQIQAYLMRYRDDIQSALKNAKDIHNLL